MDVILTISLKIAAEIELIKHMFLSPPLHTRTCIGVLRSIIGCFIHSLLWNAFSLFFTVNSSVNAARSSFNSVCPRKVPQGYVGAILTN